MGRDNGEIGKDKDEGELSEEVFCHHQKDKKVIAGGLDTENLLVSHTPFKENNFPFSS